MAVFISYSHKDKEFVDSLAANLVKNKVRVWVDTWELNVGDLLIDRVQKAIQEADALLIVLSKASVQSEWCKKELSSGLIRELEEKRVVVLPVLIEECEIPLFLKGKIYADFKIDKDKGLNQVLEAIARVTSDTLRRIDEPKYFVDFGVYSILISGLIHVRVTLLEQAYENRYSVITEIIVGANEPATKRFLAFIDSDLEWFARQTILEMVNDVAKEKGFGQLLIDSNLPQTQHFAISDDQRGFLHEVSVESRRIGEDNGKDVLVNWGDQLQNIVDLLRKDGLRMPEDTKMKIAKLLKSLQ